MRCERQKFLSFWAIFCPFSPITTQKIKILKFHCKPPVAPGQSPGGGQRGEAPGSSVYFGFHHLLLIIAQFTNDRAY